MNDRWEDPGNLYQERWKFESLVNKMNKKSLHGTKASSSLDLLPKFVCPTRAGNPRHDVIR